MMITVQEAHRLINQSVAALGMEELPLDQLQERVLAREVRAPFSLPRFTNSAMDGFALKWSDISPLRGSPRFASRLPIRFRQALSPRCRFHQAAVRRL